MDVRPEDPFPATDQANPAEQGMTDNVPPGLRDSFVIAMDSLLTFIRLFKAESSLALSALPILIALNVARLPIYVLTWISFAIFIATAVYTFTENPLLTAGTFLALQLTLMFLLERKLRKVRETCSLPETRKSMALTAASIKERFKDEQSHS